MNLYGYCLDDPVNFVDPTGENVWAIVGLAMLAAGSDLLGQIAANVATGQPWDCIDWWEVGRFAFAGAILGAAAIGLGAGAIGAGVIEAITGAKVGKSTTTRLWRAVEDAELQDVVRYGDYNIHPNSRFKRFAFDEKSLDNFIRANPGRHYTKTYIDIPSDKLRYMDPHDDARGVGKAIGIDVYDYPDFYDWFDDVKIIK